MDGLLTKLGCGMYQTFVFFGVALHWISAAMLVMATPLIGPAAGCSFNLDPDARASLATVVFVGMAVGAAGFGALSDKFGRRPAAIVSVLVLLVSTVSAAFAQSYISLLILRAMGGIGSGAISGSFSLVGEVVPPNSRGVWGSLLQIAWPIGSILAVSVGWLVLPMYGWRVLCLLGAAPMVLALILFVFFVQESPRFTQRARGAPAAREILRIIAKWNRVDEAIVQTSLERPVPPPLAMIGHQRSRILHVNSPTEVMVSPRRMCPRFRCGGGGGIYELLLPVRRWTMILVWTMWVCLAATYYGAILFQAQRAVLGRECRPAFPDSPPFPEDAYIAMIVSALADIPGTLLAMVIISKFARRTSMLVILGMTMVLWLARLFTLEDDVASLILAASARMSILAAYTVAYVFTPELVPTRLRASALGISVALGSTSSAAAPLFVQAVLATGIVTLPFYTFAGICLVGMVATFCIRPGMDGDEDEHGGETSGSSSSDGTISPSPKRSLELEGTGIGSTLSLPSLSASDTPMNEIV